MARLKVISVRPCRCPFGGGRGSLCELCGGFHLLELLHTYLQVGFRLCLHLVLRLRVVLVRPCAWPVGGNLER